MANYVAIYLILVIFVVVRVRGSFSLGKMTFAKWFWSGRKNVVQSGLE